jgi:hypothetical protein
MKKNKKRKQYHYSMPMEITAWEFLGYNSSAHGMAAAYSDPIYFKNQCLKFTKKIKKRINEIVTNDEFFKDSLLTKFKTLEERLKEIPKKDNEIDIIASLFQTIALLLGWGHFEGKFFRTPIYYQTDDQKERFLRLIAKQGVPSEIVFRRRNIILQLRKENLSYQQIGLILGISDSCVKQLEKADHLDDWRDEELKRRNS